METGQHAIGKLEVERCLRKRVSLLERSQWMLKLIPITAIAASFIASGFASYKLFPTTLGRNHHKI